MQPGARVHRYGVAVLSTVLLLWLAAPPDPVQLALSKRWGELEKALASKKLAAPTSALTSARLIACEAGQHAVADKLAAAGAAGNFYCLASRAQWAELAKESAARRPLTRAQANDEPDARDDQRARVIDEPDRLGGARHVQASKRPSAQRSVLRSMLCPLCTMTTFLPRSSRCIL